MRPVLVANLDARTRCLVGWGFCRHSNEQDILAMFRRSYSEWALPDLQIVDNGRDYDAKTVMGCTKRERQRRRGKYNGPDAEAEAREAAKFDATDSAWKGVLPELGINVRHSLPYNPRSKIIERWFGTMTEQWARHFPTFCDTEPDRKPDYLKLALDPKRKAVPHISEVIESFKVYLDIYHNSVHSGQGMNGQTPLAAWRETDKTLRKADPDALTMLCRVRGEYTVRANGVGLRVGPETVWYGQEQYVYLSKYRGRKVLVACDETDMSEVSILDASTRKFICRAAANDLISPNLPVNSEQVKEAIRKQRAERRAARRDANAGFQSIMPAMRLAQFDQAEQQREAERAAAEIVDGETKIKVVETGLERAAKDAAADRESDKKIREESSEIELSLEDRAAIAAMEREPREEGSDPESSMPSLLDLHDWREREERSFDALANPAECDFRDEIRTYLPMAADDPRRRHTDLPDDCSAGMMVMSFDREQIEDAAPDLLDVWDRLKAECDANGKDAFEPRAYDPLRGYDQREREAHVG